MADALVQLAEGVWSIRGSFRTAGVVDIGTQSTLIRRPGGNFVLLDAYTLTGPVRDGVLALTDGGRAVDAVVHLHPFHTIHVSAVAETFPGAKQYGTRRHHQKAPHLRWEPVHSEDDALGPLFADVLRFSVPQGVDFVPTNERLHFASVLAFHPASGTLVVDDTLMWSTWPLMRGLRFHPTLKQVLTPKPGAAAAFRAWCDALIHDCAEVTQVATAHTHLHPREEVGRVAERVRDAVRRVTPIVDAHARRYG